MAVVAAGEWGRRADLQRDAAQVGRELPAGARRVGVQGTGTV